MLDLQCRNTSFINDLYPFESIYLMNLRRQSEQISVKHPLHWKILISRLLSYCLLQVYSAVKRGKVGDWSGLLTVGPFVQDPLSTQVLASRYTLVPPVHNAVVFVVVWDPAVLVVTSHNFYSACHFYLFLSIGSVVLFPLDLVVFVEPIVEPVWIAIRLDILH